MIKWFINQKGSVTTETLIVSIILLFFLVIGPDLVMLGGNCFMAHKVSSDIVEQGTLQGHIDQSMCDKGKEVLEKFGIGTRSWTVTATEGEKIDMGMSMECAISGIFRFTSFRLLGINLDIPIGSRKTGVSQVYYR